MIDESGSQLEVSIERGDNPVVMLLWFDAIAHEVVFHGGNGIGGKWRSAESTLFSKKEEFDMVEWATP